MEGGGGFSLGVDPNMSVVHQFTYLWSSGQIKTPGLFGGKKGEKRKKKLKENKRKEISAGNK